MGEGGEEFGVLLDFFCVVLLSGFSFGAHERYQGAFLGGGPGGEVGDEVDEGAEIVESISFGGGPGFWFCYGEDFGDAADDGGFGAGWVEGILLSEGLGDFEAELGEVEVGSFGFLVEVEGDFCRGELAKGFCGGAVAGFLFDKGSFGGGKFL